jgi:hypothetical protein
MRCCTPFANIRTRKNSCNKVLYGKTGISNTETKKHEKNISNVKKAQNGILNRYHFL